MADVYVTQQPRTNKRNWTPDLSPAAKFGTIRFIFSGDDRPFENPKTAIQQATRELAFFDWENDFLLWPNTGDPAAFVSSMIALNELLLDDAHHITLLYWERKRTNGVRSSSEGFYVPIKFPLNVALNMASSLQSKKGTKRAKEASYIDNC